jgi:hypothetical protein
MMTKNFLYVFMAVSLALVSCNSIKIIESNSEKTYRDYVLYRCLESGLGKEVFSNDLSLGIYDELTNGTISDGRIAHYLDSLVKKEVNSISPSDIPGANHGKVIFMSCIDYYNSKELHNDIKKVMKLKKEHDRNLLKMLEKAVEKKGLCLKNCLIEGVVLFIALIHRQITSNNYYIHFVWKEHIISDENTRHTQSH